MEYYIVYRYRAIDGAMEYITDMGWSTNHEFATRFSHEQVLSLRRCLDNIGYEEVQHELRDLQICARRKDVSGLR